MCICTQPVFARCIVVTQYLHAVFAHCICTRPVIVRCICTLYLHVVFARCICTRPVFARCIVATLYLHATSICTLYLHTYCFIDTHSDTPNNPPHPHSPARNQYLHPVFARCFCTRPVFARCVVATLYLNAVFCTLYFARCICTLYLLAVS